LDTQSDLSRAVHVEAVFGSYRLIQQIGEGGMGRVFVAEHTRLGRRVALKMLRSEYAGNVEAVKRFFSEARAVNRIKHENIIEISDFVENERGHSYYIMELLTGIDLRRLEDRDTIVPLPRALNIAVQVCRGLGAAHKAGIIHRDLKPDNIFLVERGEHDDLVKLLDFGVAKLTSPELVDVSTFKTNAGIVVGTPLYMSPEQAAGKVVDHRTDIYALGVILFEMVTGQRPFHADSFGEILVHHMTTPPPRPSKVRSLRQGVPRVVEELILSCMQKDPGARPQTMQDVEARLQVIARRTSTAGGTPLTLVPPPRTRGRAWLGGAVAALAALGVVAVLTSHRPARSALPGSAAIQRAAAPPPAAPRLRVEIGFESTPPGAVVYAAGATQALGVTPFAASFDASPRTQTFEFHADGWRVARREVSLQRDAHIEVALVRLLSDAADLSAAQKRGPPSPGAGPRGKPRHTELDRDSMLNPFE
jgi:serine/threonine-protein kinase